MNALETIKHDNGKIVVRSTEDSFSFEDLYGETPSKTIFKEMRHYIFGDEQTSNLKEWVIDKAREYDLNNIIPDKEYLEDTEWSSDIEKLLEENCLFLPLTLYIHSGETIKFGKDFNNFTEMDEKSRYRNDGFVYVEICELLKYNGIKFDSDSLKEYTWETKIKIGEEEKTLKEVAEKLLLEHAKGYRDYLEGNVAEVAAIDLKGNEVYFSGAFLGDYNLNEWKEEAQKTLDHLNDFCI